MLFYNTVNKLLVDSLRKLMEASVFSEFRLVGGTALSLQLGHRESIDIDLFCDLPYGKIDFQSIQAYLENNFSYLDYHTGMNPALGTSCFIGENPKNAIKLDFFYTDTFIQPPVVTEGIRMASIEEIMAMKIDVIQRGGRKKDFWDLHELFEKYDLKTMLRLHNERYPYTHNDELILKNFTEFSEADNDFDPICLRGKYWEFIKEDFVEFLRLYNSNS